MTIVNSSSSSTLLNLCHFDVCCLLPTTKQLKYVVFLFFCFFLPGCSSSPSGFHFSVKQETGLSPEAQKIDLTICYGHTGAFLLVLCLVIVFVFFPL